MACDVNIGMCADGSRARSEMNKTKNASKKFSSDVMKGFKQLAGAATIAGAAYLALRKMTEFIKGSFKAYAEYEDQLSMLNATLLSTGGAAGLSREELVKMADELQRVTTVSNTAALEAEGIMLTFTKIGKETFPVALEAAANMSQRFGQDLKQSMIQLGTALNDPIQGVGRLRRIGISFTEQQKEQIKTLMEANDILGAQAVILDELETELGGVARAARDTFKGQMAAFKNNFSDIQRILGRLMSEDGGIKGFVSKINEFLEQEDNMRNVVRVFQGLGLVIITGFRVAFYQIKNVINSMRLLWQGAKDVGEAIKIVFNPKNWRPGAMKEAFKDLTWSVTDVIEDMKDDAIKLAMDTAEAFKKILSPDMPKIEPNNSGLKAMSEAASEASAEVENLTEDLGRYMEVGDLWGDAVMHHADNVTWLAQQEKSLTEDMEKARWEMYYQLRVSGELEEAIRKQGEQISWIDEQYKKWGVTAEDVHKEMERGAMEAWGSMWNVTQDMSENIKDAMKSLFGGMLEMLGQQLIIAAWGYALTGQLGKALSSATLSAMAYAGASLINNLQQGGTVPGGYGGGDSQLTRTEPGEMVITKENVRRNRALLSRIESGTATMPIYVYLGTKLIYKEITKAINETNEIKIRVR